MTSRQPSGAPPPRERPSSTSVSRRAAAEYDYRNPPAEQTDEGSSVLLLVPSLVAALNHLDDVGLCSCWIAPLHRRCQARRWSP